MSVLVSVPCLLDHCPCADASHRLACIALAWRVQEQLSRLGAQQAALRILRRCMVVPIPRLMVAVRITQTSRRSAVPQFTPGFSMTEAALWQFVFATRASTTTATFLAMASLHAVCSTGAPFPLLLRSCCPERMRISASSSIEERPTSSRHGGWVGVRLGIGHFKSSRTPLTCGKSKQ